FFLIPHRDSFYYWDWGRHLDLSYFDGSPMIAYLMRLFTAIFGNTIFAINFLGVIFIYFTLFFIYKIGERIFDKEVGLTACLIWLFYSIVTLYLFAFVTYDNPFILFWAATIYFTIRYIQLKKNIDIYLIGLCIGLMILAKYTAIVLVIAL